MAKNRYHQYLRSVPLFADLNAHDLDVVGQAATDLTFTAGQVLMREGEIAHEMVVVVEGTLEVTRGGEHVAHIEVGGFAGEMALLADTRRNASVAAKTDASVIHLDGRAFHRVLAEAPQLAVKMLPVVARRVVDVSDDHSN